MSRRRAVIAGVTVAATLATASVASAEPSGARSDRRYSVALGVGFTGVKPAAPDARWHGFSAWEVALRYRTSSPVEMGVALDVGSGGRRGAEWSLIHGGSEALGGIYFDIRYRIPMSPAFAIIPGWRIGWTSASAGTCGPDDCAEDDLRATVRPAIAVEWSRDQRLAVEASAGLMIVRGNADADPDADLSRRLWGATVMVAGSFRF